MKLILLLILCIATFSSVIYAEEITLTNGEWPPYTSKKLYKYGVFSHLVERAFELEGVTVKWKFFPWKRSYFLAKKGTYEGSVTWAPTPDRKKDLLFSDAVTMNKKVFFHLKSYPFDWKSYDDLKKLKIGGTQGYTYGIEFDKAAKEGKIKVEFVQEDILNVNKLLKKRIHIFPMEIEVGYNLINKNYPVIGQNTFTHHPKIMMETPICTGFSKATPEKSKRLIKLLNSGLKRMKKSGEYKRLIQASRRGEYVFGTKTYEDAQKKRKVKMMKEMFKDFGIKSN